MKTYTTTTGQNIFDVCLALYGSIEGVLDLLVCNSSLSVTEYGPQELKGQPLTFETELSRGVVLNYNENININDDVIKYIEENELKSAHGEHVPCLQERSLNDVRLIVQQVGGISTIGVSLVSGSLTIDWGDYNSAQTISPSDGYVEIEHAYSASEEHQISFYGDFVCNTLDLTNLNGVAYPTSEIKVKNLITNISNESLLKLFKNV